MYDLSLTRKEHLDSKKAKNIIKKVDGVKKISQKQLLLLTDL